MAWSLTTVVWSPIDEVAHFGYVQSIAEGDGVPVIGRDLISDEVMASVKESPTAINREEPYQPTNQDGNWGALRHQYEATAAPTYYALMALPYRLGHHFGLTGAILAVRLATGLLGLLAVPLTWALARRLLPDHPAAWLIAPALLVASNVFAFGAVTNDPLGIVLALGALLAWARALEPGTANVWRRAALAGAVLGAGLAGKATILVITPALIALVVVWWMSERPSWRRAGTIAGIAGVAAAAMVLPWLLWNLGTYHALSGVGEVNKVLVPSTSVFSFGRLAEDATAARLGLFANQVTRSGGYDAFWIAALVGVSLAGALVALARGARRDAATLLACLATIPLAFLMSELTNFTIQGGAGAPVGRHLLPALPIAMIGLAGALSTLATSRARPVTAFIGCGLIITASLMLEGRLVTDLVQRAYQRNVHDEALAPVIDQPWSDHVVPMTAIEVNAPCPVAAFEIGFASPAPATVDIASPTTAGTTGAAATITATAERVSSSLPLYAVPTLDRTWYRLEQETAGRFVIALPPGSLVNASLTDRSPSLRTRPGPTGTPTMTVSCRQPGGASVAFAASYPIQHPSSVSEAMVKGAPWAEAGLAALVTATLAACALRNRRHR